jgi:general secretion pathway protein L
MAEQLVIRLGPEPTQSAEWIIVDSDGTRRSAVSVGPLTAAAKDAAERDVIVLVPATTVLTTSVDLPMRAGSRLLAALPYALEENLADDIESLHFSAGARRDDGRIPVAVVALQQMSDWLALLEAAGISPSRIVPENHGLARVPGTLSMLVDDDQIMFNDGAESEFVLQGISPADVLAIAGVRSDPDTQEDASPDAADRSRHLLVYCLPGKDELFAGEWAALREDLTGLDMHVLPDGLLPRLAVTVAANRGINLLQGQFAAKSDLVTLIRPWRHAAALLLALAVVGIGGKAVDYYRLTQDEAALKAQFSEEYRAIRPNDEREIVDPASVVNSLRRSLGGPIAAQVFLPSLQELGQALQQHRAAEIEAISYRAGIVDVRLTAPDVATLDNIQKMVSGSGRFTASIQSTDQVGDKVSSRIQIRETGA